MLFRAVEHREFSKFCKFGARYLKNGWSHKKFCLYLKSSKSGQKYIRTKKITIFFYYATQNFALLPKTDHGPDFVYWIFLITMGSRKCFKKETLPQFTFQQDIGQLLDQMAPCSHMRQMHRTARPGIGESRNLCEPRTAHSLSPRWRITKFYFIQRTLRWIF